MRFRDTAPILWLLGGLLALGSHRVAGQEPPDSATHSLAGRWQLNEKESESPQTKLRARQPGEDPRGEGREGERQPGGGWGRYPRGAAQPSAPRPSASPEPLKAPPGLDEFLDAPKTLTIAVSDTELTLDDGKGAPLELPLDGIERARGRLKRAAHWEGAASLVVETTNAEGVQLLTRYNLMLGQRRLEVYSRLAAKDGTAVTLRRVYDPAGPAS